MKTRVGDQRRGPECTDIGVVQMEKLFAASEAWSVPPSLPPVPNETRPPASALQWRMSMSTRGIKADLIGLGGVDNAEAILVWPM